MSRKKMLLNTIVGGSAIVSLTGTGMVIWSWFNQYDLTVRPSVHAVTATGFTLTWEAKGNKTHRILMRRDDDSPAPFHWEQIVPVASSDERYEVRIEQLEPDTAYVYVIDVNLNGYAALTGGHVRTAPLSAADGADAQPATLTGQP